MWGKREGGGRWRGLRETKRAAGRIARPWGKRDLRYQPPFAEQAYKACRPEKQELSRMPLESEW
jgi:hypothetical protein